MRAWIDNGAKPGWLIDPENPLLAGSSIMKSMSVVVNGIDTESPVHIQPARPMSDDEYYAFCMANPELRIERTAEGEIVVMPPTGGETSNRNMDLSFQLQMWTKRDGRGKAFDSNAEFILPNGAARSPDAAWVLRSWLAQLTPQQKKKFLPLAPDFIVELRSPSDRLSTLQAKMREWIENGVKLGWLIDPENRTVRIYCHGRAIEKLMNPNQVEGDGPVTGFVLQMRDIWNPDL